MDEEITVIDWFAGIGGMRYGLELAGGFRTVAYSEIDPYACAVYEKHWPGTPNLGSVTDIEPADIPHADMWCGGFPCQPFSSCNVHTRERDHQAYLWPSWFRLIRQKKPRVLLLENVDAIRREGLAKVVWDLADAGYVGSWASLRACDFGAPHQGRRVYVVASTDSDGESDESVDGKMAWLPTFHESIRDWPDPPESLPMDDGVPATVARNLVGNAVVPQVVAWIGEQIKTAWLRGGGEG